MLKVSFQYQAAVNLRNRTKLKEFIASIFKREKTKFSTLSVVFCSDEYILEINKNFLRHNYYTDIITFNYAELGSPIEGELFISVDTVLSNSEKFNTSFTQELHRVIFHGVLHLCGYDDKTNAAVIEIRKKEDEYLQRYMFHK